ncbi:MAG: ABC transporter permease [Bacteroidales bacterium]|nr:ABC transporter permease [Bacteroidales bacterium]
MSKIFLIIQREYLTRVKKKSFIVMTIIGPILMAALFIVPIFIAQYSSEEKKIIGVLDETGIFHSKFKNSDDIFFHYIYTDLNSAKDQMLKSEDYALLYIPKTQIALPTSAIIYSNIQPNINVKSYIQRIMSKEIEDEKLIVNIDKLNLLPEDRKIALNIPNSIKTSITLTTIKIVGDGEEEKTFTELSMVLGIFSGVLIYFFIFLFGAQVMRGVIEEKTSRIVEIIVSSVKPFQLMLGKILGIAMVGLTQFLLWIILTFTIVGIFQAIFPDKIQNKNTELLIQNNGLGQKLNTQTITESTDEMSKVFEAIASINFVTMILSFIFYFIGGYLLYGALFAAIGSAVDNETDTQQFMLPITIPLIFSLILAQFVIENPEGPLAFWLSIIPFTSPIIMMVRIPFGVPYFDLFLSMSLLVIGFLGTTWLAAKIYRTGILMYGKNVNYKVIWKWIKYGS